MPPQKTSLFPANSPFYVDQQAAAQTAQPQPATPVDNTTATQQAAVNDQLSYRLDDAYYALVDGKHAEALHAIEQARELLHGAAR